MEKDTNMEEGIKSELEENINITNQFNDKKLPELGITLGQFKNILTFSIILNHRFSITYTSPSYIIEKYRYYIGDPSLVPQEFMNTNRMHPTLYGNIFIPYMKRWFLKEQFPSNTTINSFKELKN